MVAAARDVRGPAFHGYRIAATCFLEYGVAIGAVYFVAGPLVAALVPSMKWTLAVVSTVFLIRSLIGVLGPVYGWLVHRFGARTIMVVGGVLTAIFTGLTALVQEPIGFYVLFGVALAFADGLMGYLPVFTTVNHWFVKRRGLMMGIVAAAGGIGGFVFAPVMQLLIQGLGGWRPAMVALGLIIFILGPVPAFLLIRNRPADVGQQPDGLAAEAVAEIARPEVSSNPGSWSVREALRAPQLWLLMFVFGVEAWALGVYSADQVIYLKSVGISPLAASTALGATGLVAAVAGFLINHLSDRLKSGSYRVLIGATVLMTLGSILFILARNLPMVYLYVLLFGAGYGILVPAIPTALGQYFGGDDYARIYGIGSVIVVLMGGIGPLVTGIMVTASGSFGSALYLVTGLLILSIILAVAARPPARAAALAVKPEPGV